jgi:phosphoglycerate dehydrogenase-like enzyme
MKPLTLLVLSKPAAKFLRHLEKLPDSTRIVVGDTPEAFADAAETADVLFNGMMPRAQFEAVYNMCPNLQWVHSFSAGLENALFPALVESPVLMTNSRGVFARSLGEFVVAGILFFEKDLRRMLRAQAEGRWDQYDVEELHGKTMGIIGYGKIGQAAAERAKPFGVKIHALRKRPELALGDPLVDRAFGPGELRELIAGSDYVVVSAPLTPETRGMVGPKEIAAMKETAIFANVGRGAVVDEPALIGALKRKAIRAAVLDVFETEPLPAGHAFYSLENVLLSPHCADHTRTWLDEAMMFFVENFERFHQGKPLENIVDKRAGY